MNTVFTIAGKDIREAFRNKTTIIYVAFMLLIAFPYFDGLRSTLNNIAPSDPTTSAESASRTFLSLATTTLPLTLSMLFCTYLSAYAIVLEKARRTLESLLATPASLRQVWVGKSLGVALPGVVVTLSVLVVAIVAINFAVIIPRTGSFVLPAAAPAAVGFVLVPLLTFEIVGLVSLLQMIVSNPRVANFGFVAVFFGLYFLTVTGTAASWDFRLIYLAALAVLTIVNYLMTRLLTKDRVVLSSKA